ncbi:hypothetical protein GQ44DRAFT_151802 [Phaeosphaeriaceae sp. PMI808]|nr:hypothetical protein GQ44DRAFT_151802 [Phaeosphaeriaceae sp. PMI808]
MDSLQGIGGLPQSRKRPRVSSKEDEEGEQPSPKTSSHQDALHLISTGILGEVDSNMIYQFPELGEYALIAAEATPAEDSDLPSACRNPPVTADCHEGSLAMSNTANVNYQCRSSSPDNAGRTAPDGAPTRLTDYLIVDYEIDIGDWEKVWAS